MSIRNTSMYKFYLSVKNMSISLWHLWVTNCDRRNFSEASEYSQLAPNIDLDPKKVHLENHTLIQTDVRMISYKGELIVKKYTAISAGCTIIPGSHTPTVGIPQFLSCFSHINDKDECIVVNEDVWVAANVTMLSHCSIGRGAIVAAGAVVSKNVPPYAVVAGIPAKVIAVRFTIDQILQHEAILYPADERFSREQLEQLFKENYEGKKAIGTSEISDEDKERLAKAKQFYGITDYSVSQTKQ